MVIQVVIRFTGLKHRRKLVIGQTTDEALGRPIGAEERGRQGDSAEVLVELAPHPRVEHGIVSVDGGVGDKFRNLVGHRRPHRGVLDICCGDAVQVGELESVPSGRRTQQGVESVDDSAFTHPDHGELTCGHPALPVGRLEVHGDEGVAGHLFR